MEGMITTGGVATGDGAVFEGTVTDSGILIARGVFVEGA